MKTPFNSPARAPFHSPPRVTKVKSIDQLNMKKFRRSVLKKVLSSVPKVVLASQKSLTETFDEMSVENYKDRVITHPNTDSEEDSNSVILAITPRRVLFV